MLKRRPKSDVSPEERSAVFRALVEHYGLSKQHSEMRTEGAKPTAENTFWQKLTEAMMYDFIPAYQPKVKKDVDLLLDWVEAGGTVLPFYADFRRYRDHFYQAQLVWLIEAQVQRKDRSREWVFRWFANEEERKGAKEQERRTSLLPTPYRRRLTSKSLRQAYNSIPRTVRENPHVYLPIIGLSPLPARLEA